MRALIARSDVCILPLRDTYGKVDIPLFLLEAMAMAKPIIVTDIPPLNELLEDPVGLGVPVDDGQALAQAFGRMLAEGESHGVRGRLLIEKKYSLQRVAKQYEELYMRLLR
jgi:glycosyltransferase involved in cell wall biosynthesis